VLWQPAGQETWGHRHSAPHTHRHKARLSGQLKPQASRSRCAGVPATIPTCRYGYDVVGYRASSSSGSPVTMSATIASGQRRPGLSFVMKRRSDLAWATCGMCMWGRGGRAGRRVGKS
jgi:hypothetical protein